MSGYIFNSEDKIAAGVLDFATSDKLQDLLLLLCICMFAFMSLCSSCECRSPRRPEEAVTFPGSAVRGNCAVLGGELYTPALVVSSRHLKLIGVLLSPHSCISVF